MNELVIRIGFDVGKVTTGVAKSVGKVIVQTASVTSHSEDELIEEILNVIVREHPQEIVVGLPLTATGSSTDQAEWVRSIVHELKAHVTIPIWFVNEYLSTKIGAEGPAEDNERAAQTVLDQFLREGPYLGADAPTSATNASSETGGERM